MLLDVDQNVMEMSQNRVELIWVNALLPAEGFDCAALDWYQGGHVASTEWPVAGWYLVPLLIIHKKGGGE